MASALQLSPKDAEIPYGIANLAFKKGMLKQAIKYFSKACALNPNHIDAHINLGLVYQEKGIWAPLIITHLTLSLSCDPDYLFICTHPLLMDFRGFGQSTQLLQKGG